MIEVVSTLDVSRNLIGVHSLNNKILHVNDVFDPDDLNIWLQKGTPKYIVGDHFSWVHANEFTTNNVCVLPLFSAHEIKFIADGLTFSDTFTTDNCFNFMVNKKQVNRFLCIKFVQFFELKDFDYTWSAANNYFDLSKIIHEVNVLGVQSPLNGNDMTFILAPIVLEKRWYTYNNQFKNSFGIYPYGGNKWTWKNGLDKLFSTSAISLITESASYQKVALFTEKTLFSVLGLSFPIWIGGGYNQALEWKRIGFDSFDDIIDHSYQSYNTLIERCYYAFYNNLELLTNKSLAAKLRLQCKDRLLSNRRLLLNKQLDKFIYHEIDKLPTDLQQSIPPILKRFKL